MFSHQFVSNSSRPHGLQHTRFPWPSLSPGVCLDSCALSQWCYLTTSSSATLFSFCLQSFPTSLFSNELAVHIRWPKNWSFSFNISPSNEYLWLISYKIDWFDLFAWESRGLSRVFSSTTVQKHQFFSVLPSLWFSSHNRSWLLERPQPWLYGPLSAKWCLCFLTHCRFVIAFLPWKVFL